jgi:hypothetical protein
MMPGTHKWRDQPGHALLKSSRWQQRARLLATRARLLATGQKRTWDQRIIAAVAVAAHAAAAHVAAAHARGQIMGNQRIIAGEAAAVAVAVAVVAVVARRIKAPHVRGQMMTRVLLWGGMLTWINAR